MLETKRCLKLAVGLTVSVAITGLLGAGAYAKTDVAPDVAQSMQDQSMQDVESKMASERIVDGLFESEDAAVTNNPTDEALDEFVAQLMSERNIPGLSLAVVYDGKLIKTQGYGWLDRENNVKVRPSSVFPIASVSKPFTAMAVMLLVRDGKLALDMPISSYLEQTPEHWKNITVRHLLTHTAGLSEAVYETNPFNIVTPEKFLKRAAELPLDFEPGASWMYSNTGYGLAAMVVENMSQQPFESFMEERLFEPGRMSQTDVLLDSYMFSNRAMGYVAGSSGQALEPLDLRFSLVHKVMPSIRGAGSMTSNVLDLAQLEMAMQKGWPIDDATNLEMQQPVTLESGRKFQYGLGWMVNTVNGVRTVSHGGNLEGYTTSLSRFPDNRLSVIVLTNKDNEDGDGLAREIASLYVPALEMDEETYATADLNPALTQQLLAFLQGDKAAIEQTPEWEILLTTPRGKLMSAGFNNRVQASQPQALELLAQENHPNGQRYRYRVVTDGEPFLLNAVVTPEGLLAAIGPSSSFF